MSPAMEVAPSCSQLLSDLRKTPKEIPFFYLYDERGSELYEDITKLEEYYPFNAEDKLLKQSIDEISTHIPPHSVVVELGCGTARKTAQILNNLAVRDGSCRFAGIDVSASFLEEARVNLLKQVPGMKSAQITMVEAEYIDGLYEVRRKFPTENLCILWLGSSVGNLEAKEAVKFFKEVYNAAGSKIQVLLCTDLWKDRAVLYAAYHDKLGVTEMFIKNGVRNALSSLGHQVTDEEADSWVYEVEVNSELRRVEMWVRVPRGLDLPKYGIFVRPGERILMEVSRKFTLGDIQCMAAESGFTVHARWHNQQYGVQILLPVLEALHTCWADTDHFFSKIADWSSKPIDLRHPFSFYYGHVSAFAKIKMFPHEDASAMEAMFSRGIDPIVLNPSLCHSHPKAPPEWPTKDSTVAFVAQLRTVMLTAVARGQVNIREVNFALEHERMHQETLSYMVAQEQKARFKPSPNILSCRPATKLYVEATEPDVIIPAGRVILGVPVSEPQFVWDNEGPPLPTEVQNRFAVSPTPVTVGEFHDFITKDHGYERAEWWDPTDLALFKERRQSMPATWSFVDGEYYVHGPEETHHWSRVAANPVFVSLSEAMAYCSWAGARIMTEVEYQRILDFDKGEKVLQLRDGGWEWTSTQFAPYPGFIPMPEYPEYSTDFFDGLHYVLKGSSPVTHPSMVRDSFRNFFQKQYPYMFAKFRLCRDVIG
eukprot:TRINITY_DN9768_c0_g1_i1.p1 TRINITY_DN9768_c0_g1~~TRINITY_DN9768_c0_g1_i1.p1  ORF type:complete len:709 (-),score=96.75 TRINITY_DN9768_c0_g1_i1:541-2667(-)